MKVYDLQGKPLPSGWIPDGAGLTMMVHIAGGALCGASFSPIRNRTQRPDQPDSLGHFFLAMDPAAFRGDGGLDADMDEAIDVLHAGDPAAATREIRQRDGIRMPGSLIEKLRGVCQSCGAAFLLAN